MLRGDRNLSEGIQFFTNIHPFPSVVAPVRAVVEPVASYLSYGDNTALPVPFFAESFYVFGYFGAMLCIPLGWVYSWFDRYRLRNPGVAASVTHFLCIASIGAGTHDTSRPLTRFLLYSLVVITATQIGRSRGTTRLNKSRLVKRVARTGSHNIRPSRPSVVAHSNSVRS